MKYQTIIIDEDQDCRESLSRIAAGFSDILEVCDVCESVERAHRSIEQYKPDLLFLDIEIPSCSGFDLTEERRVVDFDVIFTTAYNSYAMQALHSAEAEYILKPIMPDDVAVSIMKVQKYRNSRMQGYALPGGDKPAQKQNSRIGIPVGNAIEYVRPEKIVHLEAKNCYSIIHFEEDPSMTVSKTLKDLEAMLPTQNFFRSHHSHIVNLNYVKRLQRIDGGSLLLSNKASVPISRMKKDELMHAMLRL